ncbi:hypothetical protein GGI15_002246 [Coemansia interrupta]|uniref:Rab proteins geranylgeranyltransferase component n=1 Tax=Coemansia interrupta TaxID=1126814 RepID=A0A9W8HG68_9FUNG|nr:hypothetical protein GGI15_002246 [Coemansia interrupta]
MSDYTLDGQEFDTVVLGTGLVESIVACEIANSAAADSDEGRKVLHIDRNPYYGGSFACFSLSAFIEWATTFRDCRQTPFVEIVVAGGGGGVSGSEPISFIINQTTTREECDTKKSIAAALQPFCSGSDASSFDMKTCEAALSLLLENDRKYAIELAPKLALCRGDMIDLLIDLRIGEYVQFKGVEHSYIVHNGKIEKVPESKEDVFASKTLSLIEKRKLMRLMTVIADDDECQKLMDEAAQSSEQDFGQFMQSKFKFDGKLLDAVVYSVARADAVHRLGAAEGCERVRKYVRAMGRYGRMAYLCAMYGGGSELAQAFCRLCAVSGGTYILGEHVEISQKDGDAGFTVKTSEHGTVKAKSIVMDPVYDPEAVFEKDNAVSRAFCILDRAILGDDTTAILCHVDGQSATSLLYLTQATLAVPSGQSILYAWSPGPLTSDKRVQLQRALYDVSADATSLFTAYFEVCDAKCASKGYFGTGAPDSLVDFDSTVQRAQHIVKCIHQG